MTTSTSAGPPSRASRGPTRTGTPRGPRVIAPPVTGQEIVLLTVIGALWLMLWWATPAFLSANSLRPLLIEVAPIALIGVGMTLVIVSAGIDVSVGSAMMVCGVITARLLVQAQVSLVVAALVAIVVGALLGVVNGVLITWGRVHAIIVTFGTLNVFQFFGWQIFGSQTVNGIPSTLDVLGRGDAGRTFGMPHSFLLMVVIAAAVWWYLRQTPGGRHFYAIGSDPVAAELAGVRVRRRVLLAYVVTGALVGLSAIFTIAKGTATLDQSIGSGKELAVIAAVVIGGTSIMGGRGSVLGTILGALLVQTVTSGVTQLGWPSELSDLFVGVFVIIAVGADLLRQRAMRINR